MKMYFFVMRTACRFLWCSAAPQFEVEQPCYRLWLQYWIYFLVDFKYPLNPLKGQANLNDIWHKSLILASKKTCHISVMKLIWLITFRKILSALFDISIFIWIHGFNSGWLHMRFILKKVAHELIFLWAASVFLLNHHPTVASCSSITTSRGAWYRPDQSAYYHIFSLCIRDFIPDPAFGLSH